MDNLDRFADQLPPQEASYSTLKGETTSAADHKHSQEMSNVLGDCRDFYLGQLCFFLACMQQYGLDPAHYYASPGLR